ncbi:MAG: OmpH family outer membrane protein [Methylothermaceae bacterium]|nr:OmpH family outer membrane protein [Methylothermaceae bacterium]
MYKKTFIWMLMSLLLMGVAPWAKAEIKVGFVNVAQVLQESPQAEEAKKRLEQEFAPRDKRLVAQQKEMVEMQQKLSRDAAVMSESERNKLEREILSKQRDLKRSREEFQEDFNIRRNEELGKLQREIFEAIKTLAQEEKYDLILTDGVVYASDTVDVTGKVQQRLQR